MDFVTTFFNYKIETNARNKYKILTVFAINKIKLQEKCILQHHFCE